MMSFDQKIISVRYRANSRTSTLKNAIYHGIRIRESDSALIMSLSKPDENMSLTIDIGHIDTLWYKGKARKLKSPGSQHKFREAEIKHLLDGRQLAEWTDPYLRDYNLEGALPFRNIGKRFIALIISLSGMSLMSLPAVAFVFGVALVGYIAWTMIMHTH